VPCPAPNSDTASPRRQGFGAAGGSNIFFSDRRVSVSRPICPRTAVGVPQREQEVRCTPLLGETLAGSADRSGLTRDPCSTPRRRPHPGDALPYAARQPGLTSQQPANPRGLPQLESKGPAQCHAFEVGATTRPLSMGRLAGYRKIPQAPSSFLAPNVACFGPPSSALLMAPGRTSAAAAEATSSVALKSSPIHDRSLAR